MNYFNPNSTAGANRPSLLVSGLVVITAACISARLLLQQHDRSRDRTLYLPSPGKTVVPALPARDLQNLPYPPDALPGGRDVETPYGSIRVYEWGPEDGEPVLFVHGISTPVVALGDLGHELVARGYRVMLFDLFGRGYSDAPRDLTYDARLYISQILLVLASSRIPWSTTAAGFHLVGYSLGGGLSVAFTRYFPHLVRSLSLIAPCGLIRRHHVGWRGWLYYDSGLLPEFVVRYLVRRRIRPDATPVRAAAAEGSDIMTAEGEHVVDGDGDGDGDGDANGGAGFDSAPISKGRPSVTVSSVVAWQVDHHEGFIMAFLSTIRNAPIYAPQEDWRVLSEILAARRPGIRVRAGPSESGAGLEGGKIFIVLGKDDGVIIMTETIEDARSVLGREGLELAVLEGGHELPITSGAAVAESVEGFWKSR